MKHKLARISPTLAQELLDVVDASHDEGGEATMWEPTCDGLSWIVDRGVTGYAVMVDGKPVAILWRDTDVAASYHGAWRSTAVYHGTERLVGGGRFHTRSEAEKNVLALYRIPVEAGTVKPLTGAFA